MDAYCHNCKKDVELEFDSILKPLADLVHIIVEGRCEHCGMVIKSGEADIQIT